MAHLSSTRPEVMQERILACPEARPGIAEAYGDFVKSGEFATSENVEPRQIQLVGLRPLLYKKAELRSQAVLLGLPAGTDTTWFEQHLLLPRSTFAPNPTQAALIRLTLVGMEDGSESSPTAIAGRTTSGMLGGIALQVDPEQGIKKRVSFWHQNLGDNVFDQTRELARDLEGELASPDTEFGLEEMAAAELINSSAEMMNQAPSIAKINLLTNLLLASTEVGPLARVGAAGVHTRPHPNPVSL